MKDISVKEMKRLVSTHVKSKKMPKRVSRDDIWICEYKRIISGGTQKARRKNIEHLVDSEVEADILFFCAKMDPFLLRGGFASIVIMLALRDREDPLDCYAVAPECCFLRKPFLEGLQQKLFGRKL